MTSDISGWKKDMGNGEKEKQVREEPGIDTFQRFKRHTWLFPIRQVSTDIITSVQSKPASA